jgi:hypothetical protein
MSPSLGTSIRSALCLVALAAVLPCLGILGCSGGPSNQRDFTTGPTNYVPGSSWPLGRLPGGNEQLWIIEEPGQLQTRCFADSMPDAGMLLARRDNKFIVPIPLSHTSASAAISGHVATVEVVQQYRNLFDGRIDAAYLFPLPRNAAVNDFLITIGQRTIRGIIREKAEALRIYQAAKRAGYSAVYAGSGPSAIEQWVANIEPGKQIEVRIRYFHTIAYADGWYEWAFPLIVDPRFGSPDAVGLPGAHRPAHRSGRDISLSVRLAAGSPIAKIASVNHAISTTRPSIRAAAMVLEPADAIPNKDFILRWQLADDPTTARLFAIRDPRGNGYFSLMLHASTGIKLEGDGATISEVYPREVLDPHPLPSLQPDRPILLTGRFTGPAGGSMIVTSRAGGQSVRLKLPLDAEQPPAMPDALPAVWARMKIADLHDQSLKAQRPDLVPQITRLALEYGLTSAYTSFIVVDSTTRTAGDRGKSVPVPADVPDGVR